MMMSKEGGSVTSVDSPMKGVRDCFIIACGLHLTMFCLVGGCEVEIWVRVGEGVCCGWEVINTD